MIQPQLSGAYHAEFVIVISPFEDAYSIVKRLLV